MLKKISVLLVCMWGIASQEVEAFSPDSLWRTIRHRAFADYDEELVFHDRKKRFATLKHFSKNGTLLVETNFKDYAEGIRQGFSKGYYPSGNLYWLADYRDNKLHGELRVYYEDGGLKRRETYRSGFQKKKHCYDRDGNEISYYELVEKASFPGGDRALQAYLQTKLNEFVASNTSQIYNFEIYIEEDGKAVLHKFTNSHIMTINKLTDILTDMPKWKPARYDKNPQGEIVPISLLFQNGRVHLAGLH